jgi:hypothetical protein
MNHLAVETNEHMCYNWSTLYRLLCENEKYREWKKKRSLSHKIFHHRMLTLIEMLICAVYQRVESNQGWNGPESLVNFSSLEGITQESPASKRNESGSSSKKGEK